MSRVRAVSFATEPWFLQAPFTITGYTFTRVDLLCVSITEGDRTGRGEGAGVYYLGETGDSMLADVASAKEAIEAGADRERLRELLPPGGARNAIDCALWDLEAKLMNRTIWELTGIEPGLTRSVVTIGIDSPAEMGRRAKAVDGPRLKVKLDAEVPVERITAIRSARPDAEIIVDVNQGWTFRQLIEYAPRFRDLGVAMIEQPLPRGGDEALENYRPPLPLCADESCLGIREFEQAARRYQMINIKLDKTGGLTEALDLAQLAQTRGIGLMVGNMIGTSLAMAPGYVIAQLCRYVDLDGALFLTRDRENPMSFRHGIVSRPRSVLWG
ncbi:MAG: dipeptide epimerase [Gammaproteobacteria bacterium]|nr:dipeptide epimerase [Gammaproteobacteria bacterium]MDH5311171.1 dipeptide epimerase [Gammaproteobacteria bacterium]